MTSAWTVSGSVGWLSVSVYLNESCSNRVEHGFGDMYVKSPSASRATRPPPTVAKVAGWMPRAGPSTSLSLARTSPVTVFCGPGGSGAPSLGSFTTSDVLAMACRVPSTSSSSATGLSFTGATTTGLAAGSLPSLRNSIVRAVPGFWFDVENFTERSASWYAAGEAPPVSVSTPVPES
jgi:hypothetical protein